MIYMSDLAVLFRSHEGEVDLKDGGYAVPTEDKTSREWKITPVQLAGSRDSDTGSQWLDAADVLTVAVCDHCGARGVELNHSDWWSASTACCVTCGEHYDLEGV